MGSNDRTFGQRIGLGFAGAALALATVAFFGYRNSLQLVENDGRVEHSQKVRLESAALLGMLRDIQVGQRGFTITGDEAFLAPYRRAQLEAERSLEKLLELSEDNPTQMKRLEEVRPLVAEFGAVQKETVEIRRAKGFEAARARVSSASGKDLMDRILVGMAAFDVTEESSLMARLADSRSSAAIAQKVMVWGGGLGVLAIALLGAFITKTLGREIIRAVDHIQGSSKALQTSAEQQATVSKEHATSMVEVASTVTELLATSRQIADSAKRVSQISDETAQAAGKGEQNVARASESVASIRRQVDLIVERMLGLGKKSQQIGGILEIINELADQTNILSINASVEAAGAGESGRRFAVVADEIRKLADRVGASTKEIRGLVEEVHAAVNTTVMATEGGAKAAEAGTRQFADLAVAFQLILTKVGTSTEVTREIQLSTKQQAVAVEQLTIAANAMAQVTRTTETSAAQALKTARELTQLSRELSRLVQVEATS